MKIAKNKLKMTMTPEVARFVKAFKRLGGQEDIQFSENIKAEVAIKDGDHITLTFGEPDSTVNNTLIGLCVDSCVLDCLNSDSEEVYDDYRTHLEKVWCEDDILALIVFLTGKVPTQKTRINVSGLLKFRKSAINIAEAINNVPKCWIV